MYSSRQEGCAVVDTGDLSSAQGLHWLLPSFPLPCASLSEFLTKDFCAIASLYIIKCGGFRLIELHYCFVLEHAGAAKLSLHKYSGPSTRQPWTLGIAKDFHKGIME
jgi:hypothetical protein